MQSFLASDEPALDDGFDQRALCDAVHGSLQVLDEREQLIVRSYFGLGNRDPMTLEQIGQILDLTRERVRQLRDRALQKVRSEYGTLLHELSAN